MDTVQNAARIVQELSATLEQVDDAACERFCDAVLRARKIFAAGAGRSGLAARAFAMRLMHLGLQAYVCGEMATPSMGAADLLVVVSGSGETGSLVSMSAKARSLGASVALITVRPESTIAKDASVVAPIPAPTPKAGNAFASIQPMGSLFEQSCFLLLDAMVLRLMERTGTDEAAMFARHANLE